MNQDRPPHALAGPLKTLKASARLLGALLGLLGAVPLLAACGSSGSSASGSGSEAPIQGGTIQYAHEQETPCLSGGWIQEAYIERQYADSLVSMAKGGRIVPWLATSWRISNGGKTYTFHLKPGVKFSNGEPLDAEAVAENFEYFTNPRTENTDVNAFIGEYFESARALGDLTVEIDLKRPYYPLLRSISQGYDGILAPQTLREGPTAVCDHPIGSGPFIVEKWNHGQNLEFVRNPHYDSWPANALHHGPPYVDKLVWSYVGNATTRYGALETGQANVIYDVPTVDWEQAKEKYDVAQYITPGRPDTLDLNTLEGVFKDKRVREAFAYGANRRAAVKSALNGKIPFDGNGALSPSTPDYDAALNHYWPYDPGKAERLLDEAGWTHRNSAGYRTKDGKVLEVRLEYIAQAMVTEEDAVVLQDLQQQWKQVGFDVKLIPATLAEGFGGKYSKPNTYDATIGYWTSPTPGVLNIVWRPWQTNGNNASFFNDPEVLKAIQIANSSPSPAVEKAEYEKAQEIVVKEAAVVGLYVQSTSLAWDENLHDVWIEESQGEPVFADAYFTK